MSVPVLRPSYWASVSGGKDSLKYSPDCMVFYAEVPV